MADPVECGRAGVDDDARGAALGDGKYVCLRNRGEGGLRGGGGAPREAFEARALFQLKFYALVLWHLRGVVPRALRLLYLRDAEICDYHPDAEELLRFERTLLALWAAIAKATAERDFRPKPSRLCGWCSHQALCPAFGGTPPPFPEQPAAPVTDPQADGPDPAPRGGASRHRVVVDFDG